MNSINLTGDTGYIKLYPKQNSIEIKNEDFYIKGEVELDATTLSDMKKELQKCIDCETDLFDKALFASKNKLLAVELQCPGWDEDTLLIGEYRKNKNSRNVFEFEFLVDKKIIQKVIYEIEKTISVM